MELVRDFAGLSGDEARILTDDAGGIRGADADRMTENAIGTFSLPLGIATNFTINKRDYLVPMAIEEPSVVAAASKAAKIARIHGGFSAEAGGSFNIGQIQILGANSAAIPGIEAASGEILSAANSQSRTLSRMGRGAKKVSCRQIKTDAGPMLIVELSIDAADAMGANVTNSMCEAAAPIIERVTGGKALLRILSNYSTGRMVSATATFDRDATGGGEIVDRMLLAYQFAKHDVYRAVTHNKGVMNGIIAVANATGQDGRAIEAAAHAYAARSSYSSLTEWSKDGSGNLTGKLALPLSVGIIGGITGSHPTARVCTKILGVTSAGHLACVMAAAGLAQNFGAMRALSDEGIQRGHMRLHARNLAAAAGAKPGQIDTVVAKMIEQDDMTADGAGRILGRL